MASRNLPLCLLFVLICNAALTIGKPKFSEGPCPGNKEENEIFYPEGCKKCVCLAKGYLCHPCDPHHPFVDERICYKVSNDDKPYPQCCHATVVCRGQPGFDEALLR